MRLVLLPGLDGTGLLFQPLLDALPATVEPLIISYPANACLGYLELNDFVLEQLPKDEHFVLLGESFSGPIAFNIANRRMRNLSGVIIVASFLGPPRRLPAGIAKLIPLRLLFSAPVPNIAYQTALLGADASPQLLALLKRALGNVAAKVLAFRCREIERLTRPEIHCELKALYIQARGDKLVPERCAEHYRRVMPNLQIVSLDGPHAILQAEPRACAALIADQLGRWEQATEPR